MGRSRSTDEQESVRRSLERGSGRAWGPRPGSTRIDRGTRKRGAEAQRERGHGIEGRARARGSEAKSGGHSTRAKEHGVGARRWGHEGRVRRTDACGGRTNEGAWGEAQSEGDGAAEHGGRDQGGQGSTKAPKSGGVGVERARGKELEE